MKIDTGYIKEAQKERYEKLTKYRIEKYDDSALGSCTVKNGVILPLKKNYHGYTFGAAGVVDGNTGKYVSESALISRGASIYTPDECCGEVEFEYYINESYEYDENQVTNCDEKVIYLGYLINHWGHFLIDCSSRLWYALEDKENLRCVFTPEADINSEIPKPICDFLKYLGIFERIIFVRKPTRFTEVIIPQVSYVTNYYYTNKHLEIFERVAQKALSEIENEKVPEKVYFARTSHRKARRTEFGENVLVEYFRKNGYSIVSPEKLDLKTQILYYRNAKNIVCLAGTIAHNMLFADFSRNITIINKTYAINMMQFDINFMKDLSVTYIDAYYAYCPVPLGGGPFFLFPTPEFVQYVEKENFSICEEQGAAWNSLVVRKYLLRAKRVNMSTDYLKKTANYAIVHYFNPALVCDFTNTFGNEVKRKDVLLFAYLKVEQFFENIYFGIKERIIRFVEYRRNTW